MSTKKAFKSIKSHIENKDQEAALYEATELLKSLDPKSPDAAQT
jgi:superkiller protein 3